jgi:PAS domain S-box-containing protein
MEQLKEYFQSIKQKILNNIHNRKYKAILQNIDDLEKFVISKLGDNDNLKNQINYKEVFDYSLAGLAVTTPEQKIIDCNSVLINMLEYDSLEDIQCFPVSHFYKDSSDREEVLKIIEEQGEIKEKELVIKTKTGKHLTVLLNANLTEMWGKKLLVINLVDITEKKETEKALQERRQLLKSTLESTADGILVVDKNGKILIANQQFYNIWKLPATIFQYKDDQETLQYVANQLVEPAKFLDKVNALYSSREESFDTLKFRDGRVFERYSLPLITDNKIQGRVWNFRDVTSRVKTEEELTELNKTLEQRIKERTKEQEASKQKYKNIFNSLSDIFFRIDYKGFILIVNPAVKDILGYETDQLIGKHISIFFKDKNEAEKMIEKAVDNEVTKDYETSFISKNGEKRNISLNMETVNNPDEESPGIQGIARDITQRVKLQNERDRLFDFSIDMISIAGFDGKFKQLNPAWANVLGWSKDEMINKPYIDFVHPDDKEKTIQTGNDLKSGQPVKFFQNRYLSKTGEYKWISWNSFPLLDEKLIYAVARDITQKKQAEENLKKSERQLKTLNAQKDKFFSIIAHDLQGPVGNFKQLVDLLSQEIESLDIVESKELISYMQKSASNTYKLLEDLLIWSRTQLGRVDLKMERVSLYLLVKEAIELQIEKAEKKNIETINSIPKDTYAYIDKDSISMVIRNLLSNAIKFTGKNGRIELFKPDTIYGIGEENMVIAVRDNGIGIPEDLADHLFKIYENTHRPGTSDERGTGLGLILCKELIEKNGGEIWVESKEGKGSTFYFSVKKAE